MVAVAERKPKPRSAKLVGSQKPRLAVVPKGTRHPRWPEVVEFVKALGVELDRWQWAVLRASLLRQVGEVGGVHGRGVCTAAERQERDPRGARAARPAGPGREAFDPHGASGGHVQGGVPPARRFDRFERVAVGAGAPYLADERPRERSSSTMAGGSGSGREPVAAAVGSRGRRCSSTRRCSCPRSDGVDSSGGVSAQPDPQLWYMGSAVDQTIMEDGTAFARVRDRALRGDIDRLAYFEWSLDADSPDVVDEATAADPKSWALTNPALGIRISPDYLEAEARELDCARVRGGAARRGGLAARRRVSGSQVISLEKWDALADDPADAGARMLDPVVLAFDTTPDRSMTSVLACGARADGLPQLEVVDRRPGTAWVPERLLELVDRHMVEKVYVDAVGAGRVGVAQGGGARGQRRGRQRRRITRRLAG